jgi:excinuclease ABC subunit C
MALPEILQSFIGQFYDERTAPKLLLTSEELPDKTLLAEALSLRAETKVEISTPQRGEKREIMDRALTNAREQLGRRLAENSAQTQLLEGVAEALGLDAPPRRIEVYDNSHIQGAHAIGAFIVAGPEGFEKNQYRKFNIKAAELTPGDDYAMMREVLTRRFARLIKDESEEIADSRWRRPDLVLIDGGPGQLSVATQVFADLGVEDVALVGISKGPDRDAGREHFYIPGKEPFRLDLKSPVLYYLQRLRDEAHRFANTYNATLRSRKIRESVLDDFSGLGPVRRAALLAHFGGIDRLRAAAVEEIREVPGFGPKIAAALQAFLNRQDAAG